MAKITPEDKEDLELAEIFLPLLKLKGWHAYLALLDKHIADKKHKVALPVSIIAGSHPSESAVDRLIALEADKGAIIGLRLAREAVDAMIAQADAIRKRYNPEDFEE